MSLRPHPTKNAATNTEYHPAPSPSPIRSILMNLTKLYLIWGLSDGPRWRWSICHIVEGFAFEQINYCSKYQVLLTYQVLQEIILRLQIELEITWPLLPQGSQKLHCKQKRTEHARIESKQLFSLSELLPLWMLCFISSDSRLGANESQETNLFLKS